MTEIDASSHEVEPSAPIAAERLLRFTVFALDSGEAMLQGECREGHLAALGAPGTIALEGDFPPDAFYWQGDGVQAYTEAEAAAKRQRPQQALAWSNQTRAWLMPDAETLLEATKEQKWQAIKTARDAAEHAPVTSGGMTFDADAKSQSRIQGAVQLAQMALAQGAPFAIEWTLADNSVVTLNAEQMIAVGLALASQVQAAHATARTLRAAVFDSTDVAAVDAVSWP